MCTQRSWWGPPSLSPRPYKCTVISRGQRSSGVTVSPSDAPLNLSLPEVISTSQCPGWRETKCRQQSVTQHPSSFLLLLNVTRGITAASTSLKKSVQTWLGFMLRFSPLRATFPTLVTGWGFIFIFYIQNIFNTEHTVTCTGNFHTPLTSLIALYLFIPGMTLLIILTLYWTILPLDWLPGLGLFESARCYPLLLRQLQGRFRAGA